MPAWLEERVLGLMMPEGDAKNPPVVNTFEAIYIASRPAVSNSCVDPTGSLNGSETYQPSSSKSTRN